MERPVNPTVLVARQLKHFFIRKWISRSNYPESIDASKQNVVARDIRRYRGRKCHECDTWWDVL